MIAAALAVLLLAVPPPPVPMDSQAVIQRYVKTLLEAPAPKVFVFSYTVSQAGPRAIEQTHRIYRSGDLVRDETLLVDGAKQKTIRIARYRNRYSLENLAPRLTQYTFLYIGLQKSGSTYQYEFRAVPNAPQGGFVIDSMILDGKSFLPLLLRFHALGAGARGTGTVSFAMAGKYWMPQAANVEGTVNGKRAREHIAFGAYRFPESLPKSTFQAPKPLPTAVPTAL